MCFQRTRRQVTAGFTLIELLVVMAILGILAAAIMPLAETMVIAQRERELRKALWEIRDALDEYKRVANRSVSSHSANTSGYPPTLQSLVDGLEDTNAVTNGQKIYFLRRIPRDPTADPKLPPEATWRLRSYNSPADKPIPGVDVYDIYSSSNERGLDGTLYTTW